MKPKSRNSNKKTKDIESNQDNFLNGRSRRDLTIIAAVLLVIVSTVAAFQNGAMPVFDKLLPLVAIIFAFFFESKSHSM